MGPWPGCRSNWARAGRAAYGRRRCASGSVDPLPAGTPTASLVTEQAASDPGNLTAESEDVGDRRGDVHLVHRVVHAPWRRHVAGHNGDRDAEQLVEALHRIDRHRRPDRCAVIAEQDDHGVATELALEEILEEARHRVVRVAEPRQIRPVRFFPDRGGEQSVRNRALGYHRVRAVSVQGQDLRVHRRAARRDLPRPSPAPRAGKALSASPQAPIRCVTPRARKCASSKNVPLPCSISNWRKPWWSALCGIHPHRVVAVGAQKLLQARHSHGGMSEMRRGAEDMWEQGAGDAELSADRRAPPRLEEYPWVKLIA